MGNRIRKNVRKDWGIGVPQYAADDLMTPEEVHDFALEVIFNFLNEDGYNILEINKEYGQNPSFICEKNGVKYAFIVKADISPFHPILSFEERVLTFKYCKQKKLVPVFCPVEFGSTDGIRFDKSIALVGDGYYCNFKGFEFIEDIIKTTDMQFVSFLVDMVYSDFLNEFALFVRNNNYEPIEEEIKSKLELAKLNYKFEHTWNFDQKDNSQLEDVVIGVSNLLLDRVFNIYRNKSDILSPMFNDPDAFFEYYLKNELYLDLDYLNKVCLENDLFSFLGIKLNELRKNIVFLNDTKNINNIGTNPMSFDWSNILKSYKIYLSNNENLN